MSQTDAGTNGHEWHKSDTSRSRHGPAATAPAPLKIADTHYRIGSRLVACLALSSRDGWSAFTDEITRHLLDFERAALAESALSALPHDDALDLSREIAGAAGRPLPPFLGGMQEARSWAQSASRAELKAFALAAFEAMAPADQAAFLHHISPRQKDQAA